MKYKIFFVIICLGLCGGLGLWLFHDSVGSRLCVRNADKELLFSSPLPPSQVFCLRFIHSVARSPVEEWFRFRKGELLLESTVYQDFGAGLPFEAQQGRRMDMRDGVIGLSGFNQVLPELTVRVGRIAGHFLLLEAPPGMQVGQGVQTGNVVGIVVVPSRPDADGGTPPALFTTQGTQGKAFVAYPLDEWAPAGTALTFSREWCFFQYCL